MCHHGVNKWIWIVSKIRLVLSQTKDKSYQVFWFYQCPMQGQRESCGLAACNIAIKCNSKIRRREWHVGTWHFIIAYNFSESISPQLRRSPIQLSSCRVFRQKRKFLHDYRPVESYLVKFLNCKFGSGVMIEYYRKKRFEGRQNQGKPYGDRGYLRK